MWIYLSGAAGGAVSGLITALNCADLGILGVFCAIGVVGTQAFVGVAVECVKAAAANCFKGDGWSLPSTLHFILMEARSQLLIFADTHACLNENKFTTNVSSFS